LDKNKTFRIRFMMTWIISALLVVYFTVTTLFDFITYNKLYNDYKEVFLDITQSIVDSNDHRLIVNDTSKEKIKKLNNILIEIQNKCVIDRSRRSDFDRIYNAQMELETLTNPQKLKYNDETLSNIYSDLLITRDMLRN
jgi:hypothetical protein